jgi:hypothetical protein
MPNVRCTSLVLTSALASALTFACASDSPRNDDDAATEASANAGTGTDPGGESDGAGAGEGDGDGEGEDDNGSEGESEDEGSEDRVKFDLQVPDLGVQACDPAQIPDTTAFTFVKTIPLGIGTLQAGFYDSTRDRVAVFSFYGQGRLVAVDGTVLGEIQAPPEALPSLDGAAYDLANDKALLITQSCKLVEVNPETFAAESVTLLGAAHGVSICAGLAIDPKSNLYVASYGTNELVVLDRSGETELRRTNLLGIGMAGIDGIAEIAGSANFLINSTTQGTAAIITAQGELIAGPGAVGDTPIMGGGLVGKPDSMLTICTNGHTWVCAEYGTTCSDFAPSDGDKQACGCLTAG